MCNGKTPIISLNYLNFSSGKVLVKMSINCSSDLENFSWTSPASIASLIKWCFNAICLVPLCWIRFFAIRIADLLLQNNSIPSTCILLKASNILLNQIARDVAKDAETYSVYFEDWATVCCFFEDHENTPLLRENT